MGLGMRVATNLKIIMKVFAGQFWKEFCCGRFFFCDMLRIPRYEMMCGELLYEDLPTEDVTIPRVNWPAFNGSLQTAFYQLMSTPSHVSALTVVGALSSFRFVLFLFCLRFFELCFSVFLVLFCFDFVLFACFCFRRVFEGFNLQLDGIIKSSLSSEENFQSSAEIGFSRRLEQRLKEPGERVMLTLSSSPWPTRRGRPAAKRQRLRKRRRVAVAR